METLGYWFVAVVWIVAGVLLRQETKDNDHF